MDLNFIKQASEGLLGGIGNIISKFKGDPTKLAELEAELKKLALGHEEKMQELAQREVEANYKDKDSARSREVSLRNTIGVYTQNIAAMVVIGSLVSLSFIAFFTKIEIPNRDIAMMLIGALITIVVNIFGYWFGSSQGSANKEAQLSEVMKLIKN